MAAIKQIKQGIFLILVFSVILVIFAAIQYQEAVINNIFWIGLAIIILFLIWKFDFIIMLKDYERAVIFRFGKFHRVGGPGWALITPPFESYKQVDLRTQTLDVPKQDVITKGNIELMIDAIIYLKIGKDEQSVKNSVLEVENYREASRLYVIAMIRDLVGSMELSEVVSNIEALNEKLKEELKKIATGWGVIVDAVEIKDVQIPKTVLDAMHMEKAAVQEKLARIEKAAAHKAEIDAVKTAAEQLSDKALAYYYIRALERLGEGKSTKFIFPMEISKLADAVTGKVSGKERDKTIEEMFRQYEPAIKAFLAKQGEKPKKQKAKKK